MIQKYTDLSNKLYEAALINTVTSAQLEEMLPNEFFEEEERFGDFRGVVMNVFERLIVNLEDGNISPLQKFFEISSTVDVTKVMLQNSRYNALFTAIGLGKPRFVEYLCEAGVPVMTLEDYQEWVAGDRFSNFDSTRHVSNSKEIFETLLKHYKSAGGVLPKSFVKSLLSKITESSEIWPLVMDCLDNASALSRRIDFGAEQLKLAEQELMRKVKLEAAAFDGLKIPNSSSSSSSFSVGAPAVAGSDAGVQEEEVEGPDDSLAGSLGDLSVDVAAPTAQEREFVSSLSALSLGASGSPLDLHASASSASSASSAGVLSQLSSVSDAGSSTSLSSVSPPASPAVVEGATLAVSADGRSRKPKRKAEEQLTPPDGQPKPESPSSAR